MHLEKYRIIFGRICAITDTVKKAPGQQLDFSINNGKEISIAELKLEGYTVEFFTTESATPNVTGVINASSLTEFEYQVVITDGEGKEVKSEWKEVTVVDDEAIVNVSEVVVNNGSDNVDFITVGETSNVFEVTKVKQLDGEVINAPSSTYSVDKAVSSNTDLAYWDGTNIIPVSAGTVTFDLTIKDNASPANEFEYTIDVVVKAGQKVTSAELKDATVKYDQDTGQVIEILIKDQNGDVMKEATTSSLVVEVNGVVDSAATSATNGLLTVTADFSSAEVGNQTIKVSQTVDSKNVKLGEFTVEVVDTDAVDIEYAFSVDKDSELEKLDLYKTESTDIVTVAVKATKSGVATTPETLDATLKLEVKDGNKALIVSTDWATEEEFTVALDPETEVGTVTVELIRVTGAKEEVIESIDIAVENTAPQVLGITHIASEPELDVTDVTAVTSDELQGFVDGGFILVEMSEGEFVASDMVEDIIYILSNKELKIEVKDLYGGETFTISDVTLK
ncbi:hypothetical protein [Maledivibacter halophilus]|uniref:Uncharacterized protein n=1 Tax=Maledivibacter halophilus TaxID=36842 RepID=A0A1T5K0E0_9FIRM|nr:hypothetical protein [Maledivibacter halophilus]SKC57272.1 hypothetical protein SAMN02194393_01528 [Maledivibacter halophilus]